MAKNLTRMNDKELINLFDSLPFYDDEVTEEIVKRAGLIEEWECLDEYEGEKDHASDAYKDVERRAYESLDKKWYHVLGDGDVKLSELTNKELLELYDSQN